MKKYNYQGMGWTVVGYALSILGLLITYFTVAVAIFVFHRLTTVLLFILGIGLIVLGFGIAQRKHRAYKFARLPLILLLLGCTSVRGAMLYTSFGNQTVTLILQYVLIVVIIIYLVRVIEKNESSYMNSPHKSYIEYVLPIIALSLAAIMFFFYALPTNSKQYIFDDMKNDSSYSLDFPSGAFIKENNGYTLMKEYIYSHANDYDFKKKYEDADALYERATAGITPNMPLEEKITTWREIIAGLTGEDQILQEIEKTEYYSIIQRSLSAPYFLQKFEIINDMTPKSLYVLALSRIFSLDALKAMESGDIEKATQRLQTIFLLGYKMTTAKGADILTLKGINVLKIHDETLRMMLLLYPISAQQKTAWFNRYRPYIFNPNMIEDNVRKQAYNRFIVYMNEYTSAGNREMDPSSMFTARIPWLFNRDETLHRAKYYYVSPNDENVNHKKYMKITKRITSYNGSCMDEETNIGIRCLIRSWRYNAFGDYLLYKFSLPTDLSQRLNSAIENHNAVMAQLFQR